MERVIKIEQLHKGSKIVRVNSGNVEILEFVCPHPHHDKFSVFLNQNYDGIPKFYNPKLKDEEWYLFHDTFEEWDEIFDMRIVQLKRQIEYIEEYRKRKRGVV